MWGDWEHMKQGYEDKVNDPWDWVTHFENAVARYTGAKHAIACDSNTNAIKLCFEYLKTQTNFSNESIKIPSQTYCSVPNAILNSGHKLTLQNREWYKHYKLGSSPIYDCAVSFYEGMYSKLNKNDKNSEDIFAILSFHHRKILNIGTGGMILTDDSAFNEWARPMIYDGRRKYFKYDTDVIQCIGWHMYMTPEQAKKGLEIFHSDRIDSTNDDKTGSYLDYTDLRRQPIYDSAERDVHYPMNMNGDLVLNNLKIESTDNKIYNYLFDLQNRLKLEKEFDQRKWIQTLNNVDFHSLPESMNYVVYDDVEFFGIFEGNKIVDFLIEYFDSRGLVHKLKFYGNHPDVKHSDPRFDYTFMPFFLGDTCHLSRIIEPKNISFKKHFIHLSSHPKIHRINTHVFLHENNLLEKSHWSWNPNGWELPVNGLGKKYPFLLEKKALSDVVDKLSIEMMHSLPEEWFESFCAIVTESRYYTEERHQIIKNGDYGCFITEKTEKCFTAGVPFIMVSTPGFLKKLKEIGFKTFDKWWDESYDEEENHSRRFKKICEVITEISSWDFDKINSVYSEMKEVLRWNQVLNVAINAENKKIKRTRAEYINFLRFKPLPYQNSYHITSPLLPKTDVESVTKKNGNNLI